MKNKGKTKAELLKELEILREERKKGVFKDIAESIQVEKELRDSEEHLKILFDYAPDAYYINDLKGNFIDGNKAAERLMGYKKEELVGESFLKLNLLTLADIPRAAKLLMKSLRGQPTGPDEFVLKRKDKSKVTVEISTYPVKIKQKTLVLGIARDISERKQAEEEQRLHAAMMHNVAEGVCLRGFDDLLIKWTNEKFRIMFGYNPGEMIGKQMDIINAPTERTPAETRIVIDDILRKTGEWHGEVKNIKRDGTHFWCHSNTSLFDHPEYGKVVVSLHADITERKQMEHKLEEMATHDFLTGLPNRILLLDRFIIAVALADRNKSRLAVMSLDLDNFKSINDTLGHEAGDQALKVVSTRLTGVIRVSDTLARFGGDEFILMMLETSHPEDVTAIAQKILDSFTEPLSIEGHQLYLSTSIGIAIYPEDAKDLETLTKKADAAMYYSKDHGRNQFKFFGDGNVWISGDH